jgi:hypothetical protein
MIQRRLSRLLAWVVCLATIPACERPSVSPDDTEYLAQLQGEIYDVIETGREAEPVPALSRDELEELEVRMHRRQVADEMRASVVQAMTPLVFAAALFAPEGPVELLLTVIPVERLGNAAVRLARNALEVRRGSKRARKLARMNDDLRALLDADARQFLNAAGILTRADRQALALIMQRTQSTPVVTKLLHQHARELADVGWIARKLERKKVDSDLVERFTFDAGVVEDITQHDSNISWTTLQRIVEGGRVNDNTRAIMAAKIRGLMGERAAREIVQSRSFMSKYLERADLDLSMASGLGANYGVRYPATRGSIDIMVYTQFREAVYVEVKTWSAETWAMEGQLEKLFAQLRRHDNGIAELRAGANEYRTVKGKVLMVEESGYKNGLLQEELKRFEQNVKDMGWVIETIPSRDVPTFADVIDGLR